MALRRILCLVPLAAASLMTMPLLHGADEAQWTSLFNGKDLTGWTLNGGAAKYVAVDGTIHGASVPNTSNSFLCTDKLYHNFILEYEFKVDNGLNSGVQIRSNMYAEEKVYEWEGKKIKVPAGRVHGYQVEIDPERPQRSWFAGIYDEGRRGWLYPGVRGGDGATFTTQGQKLFKRDEWNHVRVEAIGDSIRTYLNGELRTDMKDDMTSEGFVALQVHGVGKRIEPLNVWWRNLKIQSLPDDAKAKETPKP